jgi:hypothetical protein
MFCDLQIAREGFSKVTDSMDIYRGKQFSRYVYLSKQINRLVYLSKQTGAWKETNIESPLSDLSPTDVINNV